MNELQVFNNEEFGEVRTVMKNNEPWFVAKDVADVLEYRDTYNMVRILDEDEKDTHQVSTLGESQTMKVINESGLYSAILKSKKPQAKAFKKWVISEVLPSIRKHGDYMTEDILEKALTSPDFLIKLATSLNQEQEVRKLAE